VKRLAGTEDRRQHVLHGQRTDARLDLEHALREFRCFGSRKFFAELAENTYEDFRGTRRGDVGQIENRAFASHPKNLILDAQRTFQVRQVVREEKVTLLSSNANDHRRNGVGFRELGYPSNHCGKFSRVIILITCHLCFDHNNVPIDGFDLVLKTGSQNVRFDSRPKGNSFSIRVRRRLFPFSRVAAPPLISHQNRSFSRAGETRPLAPARLPLTAQDSLEARRLTFGFLALAGVTYLLIVLGALVRANGAGLACPDWPLCFGEVIPDFDIKVAFEWGHRVLAGSVGILFVGLGGWTLRRPNLRRRMWPALLVTAALLAAQIVLGGLTVLELLASWTVTSHLVTGNAFALALVLVGRRLSTLGDDSNRSNPASATLRRFTTLAAALLGTQIVLGGLVSSNYAGLVCPDWPTCMNGEFFPTWSGIQGLHLFHRSFGYACFLGIVAAAWLGRDHPGSRNWLGSAAVLALLQIAVGIANVLLRLPVEITGLHSALAAGLVCTLGVSVREVWREAAAI
jgi:cytochrome c oxidase assembly protein subunit 15